VSKPIAVNRAPARYVPFINGRYEVKPGLSRFGTDFGNGDADSLVFQIDNEFPQYRLAKQEALANDRDQYVAMHDLPSDVMRHVVQFVTDRLVDEHPQWFALRSNALHCRLTGSILDLAADNALNQIAMQVQEDLTIMCQRGGNHWLAWTHVCLPSHWSPAQKIGMSFAQIHQPVAGMAPMNQKQDAYMQQMIDAEQGLVRFVWGLQRDDGLNQHPGKGIPRIDHNHPPKYVRVERQTLWGFPQVDAALFTIRPYLLNFQSICSTPELASPLAAALAGMTAEQLEYKGLAADVSGLVEILTASST